SALIVTLGFSFSYCSRSPVSLMPITPNRPIVMVTLSPSLLPPVTESPPSLHAATSASAPTAATVATAFLRNEPRVPMDLLLATALTHRSDEFCDDYSGSDRSGNVPNFGWARSHRSWKTPCSWMD